jgi:hypothetical protein
MDPLRGTPLDVRHLLRVYPRRDSRP